MTYEAEEFEIGLWLRWSGDRTLTLTGQVLSKNRRTDQRLIRTCRSRHRWRSHQDRNFESMGRILISRLAADSVWPARFFLDRVLRIPSILLVDEEGS